MRNDRRPQHAAVAWASLDAPMSSSGNHSASCLSSPTSSSKQACVHGLSRSPTASQDCGIWALSCALELAWAVPFAVQSDLYILKPEREFRKRRPEALGLLPPPRAAEVLSAMSLSRRFQGISSATRLIG